MTNATRERAVAYLSECAAQIAPYWESHIHSKVPPKEVLDFFDSSVENLIAAEPGLLRAYGYGESQRSDLANELLDVVIDGARKEVTRLLQAKAAEARAEHEAEQAARDAKIAAEHVKRVSEHFNEKQRAEKERLSDLLAERDAKVAKKRATEERIAELVDPLLRDSMLVDAGGALRRSEMNSISEGFATLIAVNWPEHGGQRLTAELIDFFDYLATVLLRGADPSDGTWDLHMKDGSVHRHSSPAALSYSYSATISRLVLLAAKPYYTYEQRRPWSDDELMSIAVAAVRHRVARAAREAEAEDVLAVASRSLSSWQGLHPAPPACPYGVSPEGAEVWCRDWLVHMGMVDAEVTRFTGDGGVDVLSARHVVQVKHYTGSVSIAELRELAGVAAVEGKKPVSMTSGNYPSQAEEFADRAGMLLFQYDVTTAVVEGWTAVSSRVLRSGFLRE